MRGKREPLVIIIFLYLSMLLSASQYAHAYTNLVPPPTNPAATALSSSEIRLSWTAPSVIGLVVTGYQIDRSTDGGNSWKDSYVADTSPTTSYLDTNLAHSTLYTYRVHTIA